MPLVVPLPRPIEPRTSPPPPKTVEAGRQALVTDRCISVKRTLSMTCCVPPTLIRFETRSGA